MIVGSTLRDLPSGWSSTRLGDIVDPVERIDPRRRNRDFLYLDISSIDNRRLVIANPKQYRAMDAPSRARQLVKEGDILFSTVRTYLRNIAMVPHELDGEIASTGFCVIRPNSLIERKFIFYLLQTDESLNQLTALQRGTSYPAVRDSDVLGMLVSLPPANEQHRIVSRIEELITNLDAGIEAIRRSSVQLSQYKRSVLRSAFEGKLTREWRVTHANGSAPAEALLEQIRRERAPQGSLTHVEKESERFGITELPEGWAWSTIGDITISMKNGIYKPKKFYRRDGTACLRMYNIEDGRIVWKDIKRMVLTSEEISEYELRPGDILVNRVNSRELVGKAAPIISLPEVAIFESKNIRLRVSKAIESRLVTFWLQLFGQSFFNRNAQQTVGMASINQDQLGSMPIPIEPATEQKRVVEIVESLLSVADHARNLSTRLLEGSEMLRRSILTYSMQGKLTHQDPTDEPAGFLLERIRRDGNLREGIERSAEKQARLV